MCGETMSESAKDMKPPTESPGIASLSNDAEFSVFAYGDDVIRFRTSRRLVRYTRVKKWDDGYVEVGADYGNGEVDEYVDLRPILDNLYYDADEFLKPIKGVEVRYA